MLDFSHLPILLAVFFFTLTVAGLVPSIYKSYREKYQTEVRKTGRELNKFFINIAPSRMIAIALGLALVVGVATQSWVLGVALAILALFAPKIILRLWKNIRSEKVEAQLMDALILINNSLKSGLDIASGIERASVSLPAPISEEFGLVLNSYRLGTPLEQALIEMTERINSRTLETAVYAINIQRETGGNIIKTFEQLITLIREENRLQKKVKALTSQGRTQIVFLAIFPWALAFVFLLIAPDFMKPAIQNPIGQMVIVFLLVWEVIGIIVTKKMVIVQI